ncbi:MAG: arsenate reductase ArsC [Planctomycetota bacterium]|nr:arsenate reductase ArsC [Planctomycetota bacterium]
MKIVFVCVENSCRSQMAEGFLRHLAGREVEVFSGGTEPAPKVNPLAVKVMKEIGIDISGQHPKRISETGVDVFDVAVTMGCMSAGQACPLVRAKKVIEWNIPDPKGKPIDFFREVRDMIRAEVGALIEELKKRKGA